MTLRFSNQKRGEMALPSDPKGQNMTKTTTTAVRPSVLAGLTTLTLAALATFASKHGGKHLTEAASDALDYIATCNEDGKDNYNVKTFLDGSAQWTGKTATAVKVEFQRRYDGGEMTDTPFVNVEHRATDNDGLTSTERQVAEYGVKMGYAKDMTEAIEIIRNAEAAGAPLSLLDPELNDGEPAGDIPKVRHGIDAELPLDAEEGTGLRQWGESPSARLPQ